MARRLADVIARRKGGEHDKERERVVLLAALLHDVGHGPFSHVFEAVGEAVGIRRGHEEWSAEIVSEETEINRVLRAESERLPGQIEAVLKENEPKDIYGAIVSSQFDADRLDYILRDRRMTGVEFGHIDVDWLLDCLEVGTVTVGKDKPYEAPCLYLGPKGVQVAEEYLEARSRLYRMVYMHKTTRAAEKMLGELLRRVAENFSHLSFAQSEPVARYLVSRAPTLPSYLALDDSTVWNALSVYSGCSDPGISELAKCLMERRLYKCVDVGIEDREGGNLLSRFRLALENQNATSECLFDDATVVPYRWYNFEDESALNKVLVKSQNDMSEPEDIFNVSDIVKVLKEERRIQRAYAPFADVAALRKTFGEVK